MVVVTTTSTVTGWVDFNLANFSPDWILFVIFMSVGVLFVNTYAVRANVDKNAQLIVNIIGFFIGSIFGMLANSVSVAIPFIFGMLLAIYIWRGT